MDTLEQLYIKSLIKWIEIKKLYSNGKIIDYKDFLIRSPCAFCEDHVIIMGRITPHCRGCRVNKEICDERGKESMINTNPNKVEGLDLGGWIDNIIDKLQECLKECQK